jgi:hypothetical protein
MPGSPSSVRRTVVGRLAALLAGSLAAAVLLLGSGATAAQAHDALTGSSPAHDATVDTSPPQVRLDFSQGPQPLGSRVLVSGPDGAPASRGAVEVDGTGVVQPLIPDLPAGRYTVQWRVTSADGHPLSGTFTFVVAGAAAADPATLTAAEREVAGGSVAAAPGSLSYPVIGTAVVAVLTAAGLLLARRRRTRP